MILTVSHHTRSQGTTDCFLRWLRSRSVCYYALKHPFPFTDIPASELVYFDGTIEKIIATYPRRGSSILQLLWHMIISIRVSWRLRREADRVFAFGAFNVLPMIVPRYGRWVFFWGVDYSRRRSSSIIMNMLSSVFETIACRWSDRVIQPTRRQEEARIGWHGLDSTRSLVVPNGIELTNAPYHPTSTDIILIYIGSITRQHGIIDFVWKYYGRQGVTKYPLYIFGGGEKVDDLKNAIHNLSTDLVTYVGQTSREEIVSWIMARSERIWGIAPYRRDGEDHVIYGDSLKIKEYTGYGIPSITSDVVGIPHEVEACVWVYQSTDELWSLMDELPSVPYDPDRCYEAARSCTWDRVLERVLPLIE